jgi:hypothetical protein
VLRDWRTDHLWFKVAALLSTIAAGVLVFAGMSVLVRIEEMGELLAAIGRRRRLP